MLLKRLCADTQITGLVMIILFVIIVAGSSVYTINETESAVITTFGKATLIEEKGLHFKIPFIQHLTKVDTTVKGIKIGYSENADGSAYTAQGESEAQVIKNTTDAEVTVMLSEAQATADATIAQIFNGAE